jgi:hypothetical protein
MFVKILTAVVLTSMIQVSALANETITMFIGSRPGGNMFDQSQLLADHLRSQGYTVNIEVVGSCNKAQSGMANHKDRSIMVVFNAFAKLPGCEDTMPNSNNYVANLLTFPLMFCSRPDLDVNAIIRDQRPATVAGIKSNPAVIATSLNSKFKYVPYANSGAASQGFLAGDTDIIMTTVPKASELVSAGKARCSVTTAAKPMLGADPASRLYGQWAYRDLVAAVGVIQKGFSNKEIESLRKAVRGISGSKAWHQYAEKTESDINVDFSLDRFQRTSEQWAQQ